MQTESEGRENDIPCKGRPNESWGSNIPDKIDFKTKTVISIATLAFFWFPFAGNIFLCSFTLKFSKGYCRRKLWRSFTGKKNIDQSETSMKVKKNNSNGTYKK